MRLALVYPEVYDLARFREGRKEFPPFGPLYLAAAAQQAGHEVAIFKVAPGQETLDLRRFDAVGYSLSSSATYGVIKRAREASQHTHGTLIMAGGVHANLYPESTLLDLRPHVVGFGEGEQTILDLLAAWLSSRLTTFPAFASSETAGRSGRHRAPLSAASTTFRCRRVTSCPRRTW